MFYSCVGRWSFMMPVSGRYEWQAGTAEPNVVLPPGISLITPSHHTTMVVKESPIGTVDQGFQKCNQAFSSIVHFKGSVFESCYTIF